MHFSRRDLLRLTGMAAVSLSGLGLHLLVAPASVLSKVNNGIISDCGRSLERPQIGFNERDVLAALLSAGAYTDERALGFNAAIPLRRPA